MYSIRQPLGVVAVISPFNFPAMVPLWFVPVAIAAGNAVVLKPSEKDPSAALLLAECWAEAGLPAGVFNVVHGDKEAVDALLEHPDVKAVSFVGSTPIAPLRLRDRHRATASGCRRSAAPRTTWWCCPTPTSTSPPTRRSTPASARPGSAAWRSPSLVAVDPVGDELVAKIAERMAGLRTGDGRRGCDMGPLVTGAHRDKVASYVDAGDRGRRRAGRRRPRGRSRTASPAASGSARRCSTRSTPAMSIYNDEIFGPVLSVVRVPSYDEALELVNANPYGNGTAIFTNDGGAARRYQHEVEVGMVGVNVPIPVPMAYYSFGGWKASLFGDTHAHGAEGVHFFTRGKVVTTRWLGPEPRRASTSASRGTTREGRAEVRARAAARGARNSAIAGL